MADDAGEKMLTEERVREIERQLRPLAASTGVMYWPEILEILDHVDAQSATIKRLETPVADGDVRWACGWLDNYTADHATGRKTADLLRRQAREIERLRQALTFACHSLDAIGRKDLATEARALSLNSVETREMKP